MDLDPDFGYIPDPPPRQRSPEGYDFPFVDSERTFASQVDQDVISGGEQWTLDLGQDSATTTASLLMAKANGGCFVEDMSITPITDMFVKSAYDDLATGKEEGATFELTFPLLAPALAAQEKRRQELIKQGAGPFILHSFRSEAISRYMGTDAGERSAIAFSGGASVPILSSRLGGAMRGLRDLVGIAAAEGEDATAVYADFARMWGLEGADDQLAESVDVAGDPTVRMAVLDDKAYHSVITSYGRSGAVKTHQVPLTQKSIDPDVPIPWQKVRQGLRAIGVANEQTDQHLQGVVSTALAPVKLHMDLVSGTLPKRGRCRHLSSVLRVLRHKYPGGMPSAALPRDVMKARHDALRHIHEQRALYYEAQIVARRAKDELRNSSVGEDPIPAADVRIPNIKVRTEGPPRILKLNKIVMERVPDVTIRQAGTRGVVGDVRSIEAALTLGVEDITSAFRYAIAARALEPSSFEAQVRLLIQVPARGGKKELSDSRLYDGEDIANASVAVAGHRLARAMCQFLSISNSRFQRENWLGDLAKWVDRQLGRAYCGIPDSELMVEAAIRSPTAWKLRHWIRAICGSIAYARSGNFLSPISTGHATDLGWALRQHILDKMRWWREFYSVRATELPELGHTSYQRAVINQMRAKVYRIIQVEVTDDGIAIKVPAEDCQHILFDSTAARWNAIAAKSGDITWEEAQTHLRARTVPEILDDRLFKPYLWDFDGDLNKLLAKMSTAQPGFWTVPPRQMWAKVMASVDHSISESILEIKGAIEQVAKQVVDNHELLDQEEFYTFLEESGHDYVLRSATPWRYNIPEKASEDDLIELTEDEDGGVIDDVEDWNAEDDEYLPGEEEWRSGDVDLDQSDLIEVVTWRDLLSEAFPDEDEGNIDDIRRALMVPAHVTLDDLVEESALFGTVLRTELKAVATKAKEKVRKHRSGEVEVGVFDLE